MPSGSKFSLLTCQGGSAMQLGYGIVQPALCGILVRPAPEILLVEDNKAIRAAMADLLRDLGYGVTATDLPSEALRLLSDRPRLQLLLTDYSLPEMDGTSLISTAWRRGPCLPAILVTGHALSPADLPHPAVPLLSKPFRLDELTVAVRTALADAAKIG